MKHRPEGWVILTNQLANEPWYIIFCFWRSNDAWRISSGSKALPHLSPCANYWIWPQQSGSAYELPIAGEDGYTFYASAVLDGFLENGYSDGTKLKRIALKDIMNIGKV